MEIFIFRNIEVRRVGARFVSDFFRCVMDLSEIRFVLVCLFVERE